jgi:hypothetical protein
LLSLQSDQILLPIHLIPAQTENFPAPHSEVIANNENEPLMIRQFTSQSQILFVFKESLAHVVFFQQLDLRRGTNERWERVCTQREGATQRFQPAIYCGISIFRYLLLLDKSIDELGRNRRRFGLPECRIQV